MKEVRYFYVPDAASQGALPEEEARHATRVLRLQEGDEMFLMDGRGTFYRAEVTLASNKKCLYRVLQTMPQEAAWTGRIHLAIAPTKDMGRVEWMTEKSTEIGFDSLSFLDCQFSERRTLRTDRVEKIMISALKQSRKPWAVQIEGLTPFRQFIDSHQTGRRFICHCYSEVPRTNLHAVLQQLPPDEDVSILVGPEGDFSIQEVQYALSQGYESVTLGSSRLRTETAGLYAVMLANLTKQTSAETPNCQ